jgi:cyclase
VRSVEEMRDVLRAGADKVSLNTAVVAESALIDRCATRFGRQAVVVAIDAGRQLPGMGGRGQGGREATGLDADGWAERAADLGAGEARSPRSIATAPARFRHGPASRDHVRVHVPVIASGGAAAPGRFHGRGP